MPADRYRREFTPLASWKETARWYWVGSETRPETFGKESFDFVYPFYSAALERTGFPAVKLCIIARQHRTEASLNSAFFASPVANVNVLPLVEVWLTRVQRAHEFAWNSRINKSDGSLCACLIVASLWLHPSGRNDFRNAVTHFALRFPIWCLRLMSLLSAIPNTR